MCSLSCLEFGKRNLNISDIKDKSILEVGSYNVNGSLRDMVKELGCKSYIGIDIQPGDYVDQVCKAENILSVFGIEKFDVLICTEAIEHIEDWQLVIHNFKQIVIPGGILLVTTRSKGFPLHGYPSDYWRYEVEDFKEIFADCEIKCLESDPQEPGVFIKVIKPLDFKEKDLITYKLYSINEQL